jgi:cell division protein FtsL
MTMSPVERMYLWFLFLAYAALMVVFFGFMVRMLRKGRELEEDVRRLREEISQQHVGEKVSSAVSPSVPGRELSRS